MRAKTSTRVACAVFALWAAACSRQDQDLARHNEKFQSLGSTTAAIAGAWLDGNVSGTFTLTALEQTFALVERERTALAASPHMLVDPRGASLSQESEHLSRLIAAITHDVRAADAASVRRHVAEIPILPPGRK
jgi:hypothetical protein